MMKLLRVRPALRSVVVGGTALVALSALLTWSAADNEGVTIPMSPQFAQELESLGPNVLGKPVPAKVIGNTNRFFPLHESEWTFRITSAEGKGKELTYRLTAKVRPENEKVWQWELPGEETLFLETTGSDAVGVSSQIDNLQNVITVFEPPERILDGTLEPGQTRNRQLSVRVFDLHKPDKQKYAGTLEANETYVGAYELRTPAGRFDAVLIRTEYQGKVGPAKIQDVSYRFFAEDKGIVALISRAKISALLLYKKDTKRTLVLVEGPIRSSGSR